MDDVIEEMPVLQEYADLIGKDFFHGLNILYINHLISDSLMVARAFKKTGARLWIIGIPYGNLNSQERKKTISGLKNLGSTTIPNIRFPLQFSTIMKKTVENNLLMIGRTCMENKEKFMIVEDGGYAFPILHDNPELYPFLKHCIGAVEHTARGMWNYQYLETDGVVKMPRILSRPALTVANSTIKAKHEPYFVAQAIIDEMAYLLRKKHDFIGYKKIAVLGAGRVGRGIASLLNKLRINLTVVDHNQNNLDILKSDNDRIKTETFLTSDTINNINIIIGATGNPSLDKNHLHTFIENKQPELILVSASSKEIEFKEIINSMEELINKKTGIFKKKIKEFGIVYDIKLNNQSKKLIILADGYPVIFFPNRTNGAPNKAMDPIMSELFLAACLMNKITSKLPNSIITMTEIKKMKLPDGHWQDLINESSILKKWCLYNGIDYKTYCQDIGFTN